jgi:polyisoprenoid-binding protein YceI
MKITLVLMPAVLLAGWMAIGNWRADASKAKVQFSIKGPFGTVHGNFTGLKADIKFDTKNPSGGSISASIDPGTVSTGIGMRNHDLKNKEEWLNTAKFPAISWRSKKIEKSANGYTATGDLTLKGVTKPVQITFTFDGKGSTGVFKGQFTIKREDFNLGKPGGSVGDEVTITLEVPVST